MDPADFGEVSWCAERRDQVIRYLADQSLEHGEVGDVPAWFVAPLISVWAVESVTSPGWVGWWVVCGDLPTDYCSAENCRHPRLAVKRIADTWNNALSATVSGDTEIGSIGLSVELAPMLKTRAGLLLDIYADEEAWAGVGV